MALEGHVGTSLRMGRVSVELVVGMVSIVRFPV